MEDGLPIQPVPDNLNDTECSQLNQNSQISKNKNTKIFKPACPLPTNCIKPMYVEEGPLENTTAHFILEKKEGFNY